METIKETSGCQECGRTQRIFRAVKTPYDTIKLDTFNYTFVQTHRTYKTKSEP